MSEHSELRAWLEDRLDRLEDRLDRRDHEYERRMRSLEVWRGFLAGGAAIIGAIVTWLAARIPWGGGN